MKERVADENLDLESLSRLLKVTLQENTVVLFKTRRDRCADLARSLGHMDAFRRYGITAIACPDDIETVVIPGVTNDA